MQNPEIASFVLVDLIRVIYVLEVQDGRAFSPLPSAFRIYWNSMFSCYPIPRVFGYASFSSNGHISKFYLKAVMLSGSITVYTIKKRGRKQCYYT